MTSINTGRGFPLVFGDNNKVLFDDNTILTTMEGSIGYEEATDKFYGITIATDVESTRKRALTQQIATQSIAGQTKLGTNLELNSTTGVVSSIAASSSRIFDLVVTVSTISGAADYTNIASAIEGVIGTAAGGYTDGSMTQASQLNSAPSETYQFIILLAPGVYEISSTIVLPDYVSIIGTGKRECIIRYTQSSNGTVANSAAITTGTNSVLADFVLELNPNNKTNICGIYNDSNNVIVDNVNIRDITTTESSTTMYGFYGTGEMIQTFRNVDLLFSKGSSTIYGFYFSGTINRINNCKLIINSEYFNTANTANYGIYMTSCYLTSSINTNKLVKYNEFYENDITVKGADLNYGIYCDNSTVNSYHNRVDCSGEPSGRAGNNYGIGLKSSSAPISSTSSVIRFNNVPGSKDTIESTNTATVNFTSLGFVAGHIVKVSGADSTQNNNFFKVASVTSSLLTLTDYEQLVHEQSPTGNITLSLALDVKLFYGKISGSKHSVYEAGSNGNYDVYARFCSLEGGDISLNRDRFRGGNSTEGGINTITVAKRGGDFTNLSNAISNIVSSSSLNKYLIKVEPGEYTELGNQNGMLVLTANTSIVGSGIGNTILKFNNSDSTSTDAGGMKFTHNNVIMNLTIENNNNNTDDSYVLGAIGGDNDKISNVSIRNVGLNYTGTGISGTKYGLVISNVDNIDIQNIVIDLDGRANDIGIDVTDCTGIINKADIIVKGNSTENIGISSVNSNINIHNANIFITATSSSTPNYGIKIDNDSGTDYKIINLFDSTVRTEHNGTLSGTNEFSVYRIGDGDIGNRLVVNNSRLDGDIRDTHTTSDTKMRFNNCYQIAANNAYQPIGNKGHLDETSNGSLVIGSSAGGDLGTSSATQNTIIGINTGNAITSGSYNTFYGSNVGNRVSTANLIVAIGYNSGNILGNNCVAIGNLVHPIAEYTGQDDNILIGKQAGYSLGAENSQNVIIGNLAGANLTVASSGQTDMKNVIVGSESAHSIDDGVNNVMIGYRILYDNASGNTPSSDVLIGNNASYNSSNSANNVYLGHDAGYGNLGTENIAIGRESARNTVDANRNVLVGKKAGYQGSQGDQNIYVGNEAGYSTSYSTGSFNIGFGNRTGYNMANFGNKNIMFGGKTTDGTGGTQDATGYTITSGSNNVIFGTVAGKAVTTGTDNILIGEGAGKNIDSGADNVIIGSNAGSTMTGADYNVFIGSNTGTINTDADNTFLGHEAGRLNTATRNIAVGYRSGYFVSGDNNIFFGPEAGGKTNGSKIGGTSNNFMGYRSGYNVTTGNNNILMGGNAGLDITSGSNNVCFGYLSGNNLTTQNDNICLGARSGQNSTGSRGLVIGSHAGKNVTGDDNIMIGYKAGMEQTVGVQNIYMGFETSKNLRDGRYNITIGYKSGYSNNLVRPNIDDENNRLNICIGKETGYNLNSNSNILFGRRAGYYLDAVDDGYNILMGKEAGMNTRTGNKNINMGNQSGKFNVDGDKNICIGNDTGIGDSLFATNKNILIGDSAGKFNKGSKHIYIGNTPSDIAAYLPSNLSDGGVGFVSTSRSIKNIYIGNGAGLNTTDGKYNIGIGNLSLVYATTAENNIGIGNSSFTDLTTGRKNIGIGPSSGLTITTGSDNIMIGPLAGRATGTGIDNNILIGSSTGPTNTIDNLIAIGTNAGFSNSTGVNNIFVGVGAGSHCTTSSNNVFFGSNVGGNSFEGQGIQTGNGKNIFIGTETGTYNGLTTFGSIGIGYHAHRGQIAVGSGEQNICFGSNAGTVLGGSNNICIGVNASKSHTSGSYNIVLGNEAIGENIADLDGDDVKVAANCIIMGYKAGYKMNSYNSFAIGTYSQVNNEMQYSDNCTFGVNSMSTLGSNDSNNTEYLHGSYNITIGTNTLKDAKRTEANVVFGVNALKDYDNRAGSESNDSTRISGDMIAIGTDAGKHQHGRNSIFMGYQAAMGAQYGEISITSDKISIYRDGSNDYIFLSDTSGGGFTDAGFTTGSGDVNNRQIMIRGFSNEDNNFGNYSNGLKEDGTTPLREIAGVTNDTITLTDKGSLENNVVTEAEGNEVTIFLPSSFENIAIGYQAGKNTSYGGGQCIGYQAGIGSATTPDYPFMVIDSINESVGLFNTFIGNQSGKDITDGPGNFSIGNYTLLGVTNGYANTTIGHLAGAMVNLSSQENVGSSLFPGDVDENISIGHESLYNSSNSMTIVDDKSVGNMAIGYKAMGLLTTGGLIQENVCIGSYAGYEIFGRNNFCIGYKAGYDMVDVTGEGRDNTYLGAWVGSRNKASSENIFLGTVDQTVGDTANDYSTTYDQSFAIYRNDGLDQGGELPLLYSKILADKNLIINHYSAGTPSEANTKFYINGAVEANSYTPFTGIHNADIENKEEEKDNIKEGLILSSSGKVQIKDILNTVVKVEISIVQNDKKIYGIYAGYESRENIETKIKVASVGEGMMLVIDYGGDIENGDYISSSGKGGYGMKQADDKLHSYTVAKATEDVVWDDVEDYVDIGSEQYKWFMIGCTYHCG